jgi:UPF0716 protein FxsA
MPWFAALAFLIMPILEIYVIIQVGQVIGAWPTVALLIVESALGAWLVKREGRRAWAALRTSMQTARMPGRELGDAALILVGGTLLLTPGFVTDVVGFFFILPFTRPIARRLLTGIVNRRLLGQLGGGSLTGFMPGRPRQPGPQQPGTPRRRPADDVVEGEVVDPDDR